MRRAGESGELVEEDKEREVQREGREGNERYAVRGRNIKREYRELSIGEGKRKRACEGKEKWITRGRRIQREGRYSKRGEYGEREREREEGSIPSAFHYVFTGTKFVGALAADGAIDEDSLSGAELQTLYGPLTQQVNESLAKQEQVLSQTQVHPPPLHHFATQSLRIYLRFRYRLLTRHSVRPRCLTRQAWRGNRC